MAITEEIRQEEMKEFEEIEPVRLVKTMIW